MKRPHVASLYKLVTLGMLCGLVLFGVFALQACQEADIDDTEDPTDGATAEAAFRNAVNTPPPGWTGPVFELSHEYPPDDPGTCSPEECPWLGIDVDFNTSPDQPPTSWDEGPWADYIDAILDYAKAGQTLVLADGQEPSWNKDVNGETRWFHVPWMAYDTTRGREFIHGFTNERTAHLSDFEGTSFGVHAGTGAAFETWAFGVYNPWGGYAIGQGWPASGEPEFVSGMPKGLPFAEGTMVTKLLFTTATPNDVPYLEGSPQWTSNGHVASSDSTFTCARSPEPVYLAQVDVAVVDERSPTRWVYGTFAFNGTIEADNPWDQLSAVGLQWGTDPLTFPAVSMTDSNPPFQTVLQQLNIYEHHGCLDRMNGPIDNPLATCMACHGGAYAATPENLANGSATIPPIFGFATPDTIMCQIHNQENIVYFSNHLWPEPYPGYSNIFPLDTSLQLQVAFNEYAAFVNKDPQQCTI